MPEKLNKSTLNKAEKLFKSKKFEEAFTLYQELAYKGVVQAQYRLGDIYDEGYLSEGVADFEQAVYWFKKAAEQDDIDSQYNLAGYYCTGEGVEFSYADAYYWFRRASRLGDVGAQEKIISIKNTISKDNYKTSKYVVSGYDYFNVGDSVSALLKGWSSERMRDLIIYLNKIWTPSKEDIEDSRSKLTVKDLKKIIELVKPESCYEILADILEFEYLEKKCADDIYDLVNLFTLKSIQSKGGGDPVYGEDISFCKELKIAFDGFSENEEDVTHKSRSYVTYIHKNALDPSFVFPDHEISALGAMLRPGAELHIYSWFDKDTDRLEVINVEDHINDDKMSSIHIYKILFNLSIKYNLVPSSGHMCKADHFYTLLLRVGYVEYEHKDDEPSLEDAKVSADILLKLINTSVDAFSQIGRSISEVYVGFYPEYKNLFKLNLAKLNGKKSTKASDIKLLNDFIELSKDQLLTVWPDELEQISLTIKFADELGIPTDADMLNFSRLANVDCEAMIRAPSTGKLVTQGYDCGDYDTGFISNCDDDMYLMGNEYQKFFVDLQDPSVIFARKIVK